MKNLKLLAGLIAGTVAYRFLTWDEALGLNALIFAVSLVLILFSYKAELRKNKLLLCLAGLFVLSAVGVVLTGITFSKVMYYLTLIVFLAFVQMPALRAVWGALLLLPVNGGVAVWLDLKLAANACKEIGGTKISRPKQRYLKGWQIALIVAVTLVFLGIFATANPHFSALVHSVVDMVADFLRWLIPDISFFGFIHFFFVLYFLSLFFLPFKENFLVRNDVCRHDDLTRTRRRQPHKYMTMGLRSEYRAALVCMIILNILLLTVNAIDIIAVWFGAVPDTAAELSQFVHHGTYALIYSALLSIGILLFFFRKNLNFYADRYPLKGVAYTWIIQNVFLICSTGLRNWHYVTQYGLTYKRIGVFIFLIIVCATLLLLFLKIWHKKTGYYYFRMSALGALAILVAGGLVNWDVFIACYNTSNIADTDYHYLKEHLSYQAAPYILATEKPADEVDYTGEDPFYYKDNPYDTYGARKKFDNYIAQVNNRSWKAFNLGDWWAVRKLKKVSGSKLGRCAPVQVGSWQ